ncbi:MAG TPA: phosphodiester glycosidase family protein [Anaerolineae bacterium]|nr:phosphodiester glycosidase family protein [Anaerolineae bacterium]
MRRIPPWLLPGLTLLVASGCAWSPLLSTPTPTPTPTPAPTPTPYPTPYGVLTAPTSTPEPPDTGWQLLQPGVEVRQVLVETGTAVERLAIVRLDPATVRFRVHYDPVVPRTVSGWAEHLQPLLVVNGGYFTPENETTGLLISEGRAWGTPYEEFAGMFAVSPSPAGAEVVSVRWLRDWPYDPAEPLLEGLQSFPVLVKPGGVMGFPADADDGRPARRSVVAQDLQGRILIIVAPRGYLSLHELARFLAESDLDLNVALNLDGGFSTGLWLRAGEPALAPLYSPPVVLTADSLVPVPSVISVY